MTNVKNRATDTTHNFLVYLESEGPEWLEWAAALYESYAADQDVGTVNLWSVEHFYAEAAQAAAEEIERQIYASAPENDEYAWRLRQLDWK